MVRFVGLVGLFYFGFSWFLGVGCYVVIEVGEILGCFLVIVFFLNFGIR